MAMSKKIAKLALCGLAFSLSIASGSIGATTKDKLSKPEVRDECVIIDNDFDIDDMMAIPLVIGNKYVAAIVQSEGYTMPGAGAAAVDQLVNHLPDQPNHRKIPVIVGGQQTPAKGLESWSWLPYFRSMMNQAVALLPEQPKPWPLDKLYAKKVAQSVSSCKKVSVLVIGTYTSFINYSPLIRDKIDKVVIMGQPIGDQSRTMGRESFNCNFDLPACQTAMTQLAGLNAFFVDIPREHDIGGVCSNTLTPSSTCYTPSYEMVMGGNDTKGLENRGLPGRLKQALTNPLDCNSKFTTNSDPRKSMPNPQFLGSKYSNCSALSIWVPPYVAAGPGGEMLLWDQTAAMFLLHPERFALYYPPTDPGAGGKHYEPIVIDGSHEKTVKMLREMWTETTNRSANSD